jgi:hypothetical protein
MVGLLGSLIHPWSPRVTETLMVMDMTRGFGTLMPLPCMTTRVLTHSHHGIIARMTMMSSTSNATLIAMSRTPLNCNMIGSL